MDTNANMDMDMEFVKKKKKRAQLRQGHEKHINISTYFSITNNNNFTKISKTESTGNA